MLFNKLSWFIFSILLFFCFNVSPTDSNSISSLKKIKKSEVKKIAEKSDLSVIDNQKKFEHEVEEIEEPDIKIVDKWLHKQESQEPAIEEAKKEMSVTVDEAKDYKIVKYEELDDKIKEYRVGKDFRFKILGSVNFQSFYDSHQFIGFTHDAVVYFPRPKNCDDRGLDISKKDQFSMLGISYNSKIMFLGPDVWGAKTGGRLDLSIGGLSLDVIFLRMKNGFVDFKWKKTKLRIGHYYHPLALGKTYPTTVSGSEGIGYDPFRKAALMRVKHKIDRFELIMALAKIYSSLPSLWSTTPDLFFQINVEQNKNLFGVGINFHIETPRLVTEEFYKTTEQVKGMCPFLFAHIKRKPFRVKMRLSYSENGAPFFIMEAYAVKFRNPETDERVYTNLRALSFWIEFIYKKENKRVIEPALFIGISKNLGARDRIVKSYTDDSGSIIPLLFVPGAITFADYMFVIAPRVRIRIKNFVIGAEIEYSRGGFARDFTDPNWRDDFDNYGRVVNPTPSSNTRFVFTTSYVF